MNRLLRLCGLVALLVSLVETAPAQTSPAKISRIDISHAGPPAASDEIIRSHIRVKVGDEYLPAKLDDDIHTLYATGLFYNIRVRPERAPDGGMVLIYVLQGKPRLTDIQIKGNEKLKTRKIKKEIKSKVGEPLDERKLFTDSQAIQSLYQKKGYPGTTVKAKPSIIEESGTGVVEFEIVESEKVQIIRVDFVGAQAFTQKELRKQIKTKQKWMWSWLTGRGSFKDEQFEEDQEKLKEFYRDRGYIDFEIKDIQFEKPTPRKMIIRFNVYEGRQYRVGKITFSGTTTLPTNAVSPAYKAPHIGKHDPDRADKMAAATLHRNFIMKEGDVFKSKDLAKDSEAIEDFYGARGQIDVASPGNLNIRRIPNTETGTIDLDFLVNEGQVSYIEKIEIRGNVKTKDKVIRRELTVSPGEPFNMVAVKLSKRRLEGMQYFEPDSVNARPEPTTIPSRKDLVIDVVEKQTGNLRLGAGFSSVDSVVGFAEVTQGNFDLFNPPRFTGGGQKMRLWMQLGTERQDFEISFTEPWFLDRKLSLNVDLYHTEKSYLSPNDLYDETRTGARVGLSKALWSDFFIGSVGYNIENVQIDLEDGAHGWINSPAVPGGPIIGPGAGIAGPIPPNIPPSIMDEEGDSLLTRITAALIRDTRNSTFLPDGGQRTQLYGEIASTALGGERDFYKLGLESAWYFRGLAKGHVLEVVGRIGVADGFGGDDVPFYERYYLGGAYTLRGFEYRDVSPRDPYPYGGFYEEPVGGNTYMFGSVEYSVPVFKREKTGVRVAVFYDIGKVNSDAYDFDFTDFSDDWGIGLRLELPIGPLRLDYAFPIHHDDFNSGGGRFQFTAGWTRPF